MLSNCTVGPITQNERQDSQQGAISKFTTNIFPEYENKRKNFRIRCLYTTEKKTQATKNNTRESKSRSKKAQGQKWKKKKN